MGEDGAYIQFWPIEDIITTNKDYEKEMVVHGERSPGIFFAGDGGGEGFAFMKGTQEVSKVPLTLDWEASVKQGNDFSSFVLQLSEELIF